MILEIAVVLNEKKFTQQPIGNNLAKEMEKMKRLKLYRRKTNKLWE